MTSRLESHVIKFLDKPIFEKKNYPKTSFKLKVSQKYEQKVIDLNNETLKEKGEKKIHENICHCQNFWQF